MGRRRFSRGSFGSVLPDRFAAVFEQAAETPAGDYVRLAGPQRRGAPLASLLAVLAAEARVRLETVGPELCVCFRFLAGLADQNG